MKQTVHTDKALLTILEKQDAFEETQKISD